MGGFLCKHMLSGKPTRSRGRQDGGDGGRLRFPGTSIFRSMKAKRDPVEPARGPLKKSLVCWLWGSKTH